MRLDRIHPSHLGRGSDSSGWRVTDDILRLLLDQLQLASTGFSTEFLQTVRETVEDCLPDGLA